ncbi:MAG: phosphate signaling complex protein PhoU [Bacteroidetes bacterium]|jgi:phosphate transport system protein|nr:phosphate signaling complex protein PhoU [Bacteroidota bacterium]
MSHIDIETGRLRETLKELMMLTTQQIRKSQDVVFNFDKELAREVIFYEKHINSLELKIDRDCENILALLNPVAVDLRFILATLKINPSLERIADNAESMVRYVLEMKEPYDSELMRQIKLREMFDIALSMLSDVYTAFTTEDTRIARNVLLKDDLLDEINMVAAHTAEAFIKKNSALTYQSLFVLSNVRKLERVGDQTKNIAEEIIFYLEARVLKHSKPGGI